MYGLTKFILMIIFHLFFRVEVYGREHIPARGPVIIASNHLSLWDPPLLGYAVWHRQINFMAKEELFSIPLFGTVIRWLNAFPVKRGQADREAIRIAITRLEEGKVLCIFPEGTRSQTGRLGKAEPGSAMLAVYTGSPVVPAAVFNTNKVLKRRFFLPKFIVRFGSAIAVPKSKGKENMMAVSDLVMSRIASLQEDGDVSSR